MSTGQGQHAAAVHVESHSTFALKGNTRSSSIAAGFCHGTLPARGGGTGQTRHCGNTKEQPSGPGPAALGHAIPISAISDGV